MSVSGARLCPPAIDPFDRHGVRAIDDNAFARQIKQTVCSHAPVDPFGVSMCGMPCGVSVSFSKPQPSRALFQRARDLRGAHCTERFYCRFVLAAPEVSFQDEIRPRRGRFLRETEQRRECHVAQVPGMRASPAPSASSKGSLIVSLPRSAAPVLACEMAGQGGLAGARQTCDEEHAGLVGLHRVKEGSMERHKPQFSQGLRGISSRRRVLPVTGSRKDSRRQPMGTVSFMKQRDAAAGEFVSRLSRSHGLALHRFLMRMLGRKEAGRGRGAGRLPQALPAFSTRRGDMSAGPAVRRRDQACAYAPAARQGRDGPRGS